LAAVELSNKLGQALGLDLPGTLVFDYPSVGAMAAHLLTRVRPADQAAEPALELAPIAAPTFSAPLAGSTAALHVALAARLPLPGHVAAGQELAPGQDAITAVPFKRWDLDAQQVRVDCQYETASHF